MDVPTHFDDLVATEPTASSGFLRDVVGVLVWGDQSFASLLTVAVFTAGVAVAAAYAARWLPVGLAALSLWKRGIPRPPFAAGSAFVSAGHRCTETISFGNGGAAPRHAILNGRKASDASALLDDKSSFQTPVHEHRTRAPGASSLRGASAKQPKKSAAVAWADEIDALSSASRIDVSSSSSFSPNGWIDSSATSLPWQYCPPLPASKPAVPRVGVSSALLAQAQAQAAALEAAAAAARGFSSMQQAPVFPSFHLVALGNHEAGTVPGSSGDESTSGAPRPSGARRPATARHTHRAGSATRRRHHHKATTAASNDTHGHAGGKKGQTLAATTSATTTAFLASPTRRATAPAFGVPAPPAHDTFALPDPLPSSIAPGGTTDRQRASPPTASKQNSARRSRVVDVASTVRETLLGLSGRAGAKSGSNKQRNERSRLDATQIDVDTSWADQDPRCLHADMYDEKWARDLGCTAPPRRRSHRAEAVLGAADAAHSGGSSDSDDGAASVSSRRKTSSGLGIFAGPGSEARRNVANKQKADSAEPPAALNTSLSGLDFSKVGRHLPDMVLNRPPTPPPAPAPVPVAQPDSTLKPSTGEAAPTPLSSMAIGNEGKPKPTSAAGSGFGSTTFGAGTLAGAAIRDPNPAASIFGGAKQPSSVTTAATATPAGAATSGASPFARKTASVAAAIGSALGFGGGAPKPPTTAAPATSSFGFGGPATAPAKVSPRATVAPSSASAPCQSDATAASDVHTAPKSPRGQPAPTESCARPKTPPAATVDPAALSATPKAPAASAPAPAGFGKSPAIAAAFAKPLGGPVKPLTGSGASWGGKAPAPTATPAAHTSSSSAPGPFGTVPITIAGSVPAPAIGTRGTSAVTGLLPSLSALIPSAVAALGAPAGTGLKPAPSAGPWASPAAAAPPASLSTRPTGAPTPAAQVPAAAATSSSPWGQKHAAPTAAPAPAAFAPSAPVLLPPSSATGAFGKPPLAPAPAMGKKAGRYSADGDSIAPPPAYSSIGSSVLGAGGPSAAFGGGGAASAFGGGPPPPRLSSALGGPGTFPAPSATAPRLAPAAPSALPFGKGPNPSGSFFGDRNSAPPASSSLAGGAFGAVHAAGMPPPSGPFGAGGAAASAATGPAFGGVFGSTPASSPWGGSGGAPATGGGGGGGHGRAGGGGHGGGRGGGHGGGGRGHGGSHGPRGGGGGRTRRF
jgi:hypothetical protein